MIASEVLHFEDDGITPNNRLPVIIYRAVTKSIGLASNASLQTVFEANNWTNNWNDIILEKNHYHSTTHEVIGIHKGKVDLHLGGKNGSMITVKSGDVIIIPAGVGHYSLNNAQSYDAIGGYPNGAEWDVIFDEQGKHATALATIKELSIPETDPVFGTDGLLFEFWK